MNIAICDDEASCLEAVIENTKKYAELRESKNITFESFSHPEDLIAACKKNGGYDIYILDIVMPDVNGIQIGEKIRSEGYDGKIIYITSSEDYSLDAFRVKAFDYLLKPVSEETFFKTLDEVTEQIFEKKDKYLIVKSKDRSTKIFYDSIMYAELTKRAVRYYLSRGKTIESVTLRTTFTDAMSELLSDKRFYLCSQSMLVNLDHITEVENVSATFGDTYKIFFGEKTCRKLRSVWSNYLFE